MLTAAPESMEVMENAGLPSARMTEFIILDSMKNGKKARITSRYSIAIPRLFSEAPNSVSSGALSGYPTAISSRPVSSVTVTPVPMALSALCMSFLPRQIFRYAAQPSPKHQAKACAMMKNGKTTPVAALPSVLSSLLPIKI